MLERPTRASLESGLVLKNEAPERRAAGTGGQSYELNALPASGFTPRPMIN